jgi:hypothetical protein
MFRTQAVTVEQPCHLVCDREFIRKYGLGVIPPGTGDLRRYVNDGYLISAQTIAGLATAICVDADGLEATVHRFNGFADKSIDLDFHKGETDFELFYGDPGKHPNPFSEAYWLRHITRSRFGQQKQPALSVWRPMPRRASSIGIANPSSAFMHAAMT